MKAKLVTAAVLIIAGCSIFGLAVAQVEVTLPPQPQPEVKSVDINKDGKTDVNYYREGDFVGKAEADTHNDGTPDIIVHTKDGKFESAEVDTDNDGTPDKKFTDQGEFTKWVNENNPDYEKELNRPDWQWKLVDF
jgi:uncharacterized protein YdeI (BOF family)